MGLTCLLLEAKKKSKKWYVLEIGFLFFYGTTKKCTKRVYYPVANFTTAFLLRFGWFHCDATTYLPVLRCC